MLFRSHEARLVAGLAVRGDLDQLGAAEHLGDHPGLGQGKPATAGCDAQGQASSALAGAQLGDLARRVGFGLDLGLDVETEQLAQRAHVLVGLV